MVRSRKVQGGSAEVNKFSMSVCAVLALAVVPACSSSTQSESDRQATGVDGCVDASGDNSELRTLVEAAVNTPALQFDGRVATLGEVLAQSSPEPGADPIDQVTPQFYGDDQVPAGGDADFAALACGLEFAWASDLDAADRDRLRETPGFIRSLGRQACMALEQGGVSALETAEASVEAETADPEALKASRVQSAQQYYDATVSGAADATAADPTLPTEQIDLLTGIARQQLETAQNTSPEDFVRIERQSIEVQRAALENQCPTVAG